MPRVPADRLAPGRADRRCRGARALGASDPRAPGACSVHRPRGGDRSDHSARTTGCSSAPARSFTSGTLLLDDAPPPYVSVNVSIRQLHEDAFPGCVAEILAGTGLRPQSLVLEITEGLLADDHESDRSPAARVQATRNQDRRRRLRHRLLGALTSPAFPDRHPQDRQVVHRRAAHERADGQPRPGHHQPRRNARTRRDRRGDREAAAGRPAQGDAITARPGIPVLTAGQSPRRCFELLREPRHLPPLDTR